MLFQHNLVGLDNQGATCYLNSLIQTLYMTRPLRGYVDYTRIFKIREFQLVKVISLTAALYNLSDEELGTALVFFFSIDQLSILIALSVCSITIKLRL